MGAQVGSLSLTACWCAAVQAVAVDDAAVEAICKQVRSCKLVARALAAPALGQNLPTRAMQRLRGTRGGTDYGGYGPA